MATTEMWEMVMEPPYSAYDANNQAVTSDDSESLGSILEAYCTPPTKPKDEHTSQDQANLQYIPDYQI